MNVLLFQIFINKFELVCFRTLMKCKIWSRGPDGFRESKITNEDKLLDGYVKNGSILNSTVSPASLVAKHSKKKEITTGCIWISVSSTFS